MRRKKTTQILQIKITIFRFLFADVQTQTIKFDRIRQNFRAVDPLSYPKPLQLYNRHQREITQVKYHKRYTLHAQRPNQILFF